MYKCKKALLHFTSSFYFVNTLYVSSMKHIIINVKLPRLSRVILSHNGFILVTQTNIATKPIILQKWKVSEIFQCPDTSQL